MNHSHKINKLTHPNSHSHQLENYEYILCKITFRAQAPLLTDPPGAANVAN